MADFDLSARITADASGLVAAGAQGEKAIDGIADASRRASTASEQLDKATASAGDAAGRASGRIGTHVDAILGTATASDKAATSTRSLGEAVVDAAGKQASAGTTTSAAKERVAAATAKLEIAETRAAAASAGEELALRKLAATASGTADEQIRATQGLLNATARRQAADEAMVRAQGAVTKAGEEAAGVHTKVAESSGVASTAQIVLESAIRKTADQYAAGAPLGTIFAEHIGTVAEVLQLYALSAKRGQDATKAVGEAQKDAGADVAGLGATVVEGADKFTGFKGVIGAAAEFLSGPWGIAVSIAAAVLPSLISGLLETESAADRAKAAEDALARTQEDLADAIDKTNGKLAEQNRLRAQAGNIAAPVSIAEGYGSIKGNIDEGFKAARSTLSSFGQSRAGPTGVGLDLSRILADAGTRFGVLTSEVNKLAIASGDPKIVKLAGTLNEQYSAGTRTLGTIRQLTGANRDVATALAGGTVVTKESVDQSIKLATAHDGVTRAQARLAGSTAALNALFDKPSSAARDAEIAKAKASVVADTNAVTAAQEAAKKKPKPKSTAPLEEFGLSAADKIANIVGSYDDAPKVLDQTNAKVRELDRLVEQLGRRKPPNFQDLIDKAKAAETTVRNGLIVAVAQAFEVPKTASEKAAVAVRSLDLVIDDLGKRQPPGFENLIATARTAQGVIVDSLQRPYRDFITDQARSLEVQRLATAGFTDQADALKQIQQLERAGAVLTAQQKDAILATVEAMRFEQRQLEIRNELNAKYVDGLGAIKAATLDASQAFVRGDLGQFLKTPGKLLDAFQTVKGDELFDKLFSGAFRDLKDQVEGVSPVKDASQRMGAAVDDVTAATKASKDAYASLTPGLGSATSALSSFTTALGSAAAGVSGGGAAALLAHGNGAPSAVQLPGAATADTSGDVVVTGRRAAASTSDPLARLALPSLASDPRITAALGAKPLNATSLFENALSKVGTSVAKAFTNRDAAESIGKSIGKYSGLALQGAATGSIVAGVGKALGVNVSASGAQIGGAIGGVLGGIKGIASALGPFGAALSPVLGVVGGLIGGLFSSPKSGGATITSAGVTGTVGTDKSGQQAGQTAGSAIITNVRQIAGQLGGSLGNFGTITIGSYGDKFRVNDHGTNLKSNNDVEQFNTIEEAQAFALKQAIAKGAVTGLSDAVSAALRSSSDVQGALQEALGVKALEYDLLGAQGAVKKTFDVEATAAKERLRLAQAYGLSIVAVTKLNEEKRADLIESTLKTRIGSLQDFLTSLQTGDLFEGSAADRRTALQTQIAAAQADAEAGKDGAADKLAQLEQQLVTTSKDAYGTAGGEYTSDRSAALDAVQRVINMETDRVNTAAGITQAQTDAINQGNTLTGETNDLLAQIVANMSGGSANKNYTNEAMFNDAPDYTSLLRSKTGEYI